MSVAAPAPSIVHRSSRRVVAGLPSLAGLAIVAALIPLQHSWVAGVIVLALVFTVPGLLLLRALRVGSGVLAAYPLFVVPASLTVLFAAGLGADLLGPHLGIPLPLRGDTTALAVLGVSLALWLCGLPAAQDTRLFVGRALRSPSWLVPLALPLLAAAGALLLSHGHGPAVARVGQALVAVALFALLLVAPRLTRGQVAMVLFACALAAEWAFSLRSQEVIGFDITTEIQIARRTQEAGIWHSLNRGDAYGAMLSVTVLPSVLKSLSGCSPLIAFKVVYPVLTALLPVSLFLVGERFMRRGFAAGAAALLLVQTYFFQLIPQLARQEIALVFFAGLVAAMLDDRLRWRQRAALMALLSGGVVVSHYSTTYLAIPIVVITFLLTWLLAKLRPTAFVCALACSGVVLAGGAVLWDGTITHSAQNLTAFTSTLNHDGLDLLPNNKGGIINTYLNGTNEVQVSARSFQALAVRSYQVRANYIHPLPQAFQSRYDLRDATVHAPPKRLADVSEGLHYLSIAFAELLLLFAGIGGLVLALRRRSTPMLRQLGALSLATAAVLVLIRFSGTFAASYNQTRALAQALLIIALPAAWLVQHALDRVRRRRVIGRVVPVLVVAITLAFPIMLSYDNSLTYVLTGGGTLLSLSDNGEDYQRQYMTPAELLGARWATFHSHRTLLYADPYGQLRLNASTGAVGLNLITPRTLDHAAWVYGTHTNVVLGVTRGQVRNSLGLYAWPNAFLGSNFDTMYDDGDSKVYHR